MLRGFAHHVTVEADPSGREEGPTTQSKMRACKACISSGFNEGVEKNTAKHAESCQYAVLTNDFVFWTIHFQQNFFLQLENSRGWGALTSP